MNLFPKKVEYPFKQAYLESNFTGCARHAAV